MSRMLVIPTLALVLVAGCNSVPEEKTHHDHLLGAWQGAVHTPVGELPVTFYISEGHLGLNCILNSPNQSRRPVYCGEIAVSEQAVQILVPEVDASYTGWIGDNQLSGHWTQAGLNFHLELARLSPPELKPAAATPE